jgi:hypothetical protein
VVFCKLCNLLFWVLFWGGGVCPCLECGIQSFLDGLTLCLGYKDCDSSKKKNDSFGMHVYVLHCDIGLDFD